MGSWQCLVEVKRQVSILQIFLTILLPRWGPIPPAAGGLNSVGRPLCSLAGCQTRQLGGSHCRIVWILNSVGCLSRSLAGCLTLKLRSYRCPIVAIPFTAILSHTLLLLHLCLECPRNVFQNYRLYPVWTIGTRLCLLGKKIFSVSDYVSVLENTR